MAKSLCLADVYEDIEGMPNSVMPYWIYELLNSPRIAPALFDIGEANTLEALLRLVEDIEYHGGVIWRFKYKGKIGYGVGSVIKIDDKY